MYAHCLLSPPSCYVFRLVSSPVPCRPHPLYNAISSPLCLCVCLFLVCLRFPLPFPCLSLYLCHYLSAAQDVRLTAVLSPLRSYLCSVSVSTRLTRTYPVEPLPTCLPLCSVSCVLCAPTPYPLPPPCHSAPPLMMIRAPFTSFRRWSPGRARPPFVFTACHSVRLFACSFVIIRAPPSPSPSPSLAVRVPKSRCKSTHFAPHTPHSCTPHTQK